MVDIVHRIAIKAAPAQVYGALATLEGVAGWWTTDTSGQSRVGGVINTRFLRPDGTELGKIDLEVVKLDPGKEVQWRVKAGPEEWIGTDVVFSLSQEGDQTLVRFGHRKWREEVDFTAHCSMKWATFLLSLRDLVETGRGKPAPGDLKIDTWN